MRFVHDGVAGRGSFARDGDVLWLSHGGLTLRYDDVTLAAAEKDAAGSDGRLLAPMDGKIVALMTEPGATIVKGQTLGVLEAMKMEFPICSGVDGVVEAVSIQPGLQVKARALLIAIKPAGGAGHTGGMS